LGFPALECSAAKLDHFRVKGVAVDCRELEKYLYEQIPLSKTMGVQVLDAGWDGVQLTAPLHPNINHRETVFGGSMSAVAILAGWALVYVRLRQEGIQSSVVIQRNTMNYERPIPGEFTALSTVEDSTAWQKFVKVLKRKNRARIPVAVSLFFDGQKAGLLEGDFVALGA
jgi:thioesterase domain-containing protein